VRDVALTHGRWYGARIPVGVRGRILFNGNLGSVATYAERIRPFVLGSRADGRPPNVLVITGAWKAGERDDAPIRAALHGIGVPASNVANLEVWHHWVRYLQARPDVAALDAEINEATEAIRKFYVEKTAFHAQRIRGAVDVVRSRVPAFQLGSLPSEDRDPLWPEALSSGTDVLVRAVTRDLAQDLRDLVVHDRRMLDALDEIEDLVRTRTALRFDPEWNRERMHLEEKILEADAVLLFGGDPVALLHALRFFDLRGALQETLRRGATLCSISAGSLVLCERVIVYDDFATDPFRREFRLIDRGLGLVGALQILPHCRDRIHTDDPDNLAYLARRFASHACVGLNEESFLLVDLAGPTVRSVGTHDAVIVFGPDGVKRTYGADEVVPLGQ
jgi:hypothetical protein